MTGAITLSFANTDAVARALAAYGDAVEADLHKLVVRTALDVRRDVIKRYKSGPKTGTIYKRRNRLHQASAPGEAPAVDRGGLMSSIYYTQPTRLSATVGSRLAYGYWLEFGSQVVDARPAWVPAMEAMRPTFTDRAEAILRKHAR